MRLVILTFLAVVGSAFAASLNEGSASDKKVFQNVWQDYSGNTKERVSNGLKELAEKICENKATDLSRPLEETVTRAQEVHTDGETVCNIVTNHLENVMEPMVSTIDGCVPNDQAGVADYIVKAVVHVFHYICQTDGEHILELMNPCINELGSEINECLENGADKWNQITTVAGKSFKQEACREYNDIRPCIQQAITSKCKAPITEEAIFGVMDSAFKTPCAYI